MGFNTRQQHALSERKGVTVVNQHKEDRAEYARQCLAARHDINARPALHAKVMSLLAELLPYEPVRVRLGLSGEEASARQLPLPYDDLFLCRGAIWQAEEGAPLVPIGGIPVPVQYISATSGEMLDLICDPELPTLLAANQ